MPLLICLGILWGLAGPFAVLLCIILFGRLRVLQDTVDSLRRRLETFEPPQTPPPEPSTTRTAGIQPGGAPAPAGSPPEPAESVAAQDADVAPQRSTEAAAVGGGHEASLHRRDDLAGEQLETRSPPAAGSILEERIGTRWVLIAGVIAVMFAAGFFLKYAYDNFSMSDPGKVIVVAVCGMVALAAGEISRRRGYDIVAKGVTALGFAILYIAVFSACRLYGLVGVYPAFGMAIVITAAAMAYAVALDEVLIAFLSLLGGFAAPVLLPTGENLPVPLFSYVLVLSVGAMLCSYYRRWHAVNILAVIGTYALYAGWYETFFRKQFYIADGLPGQTSIALGWLGVFFVIYLLIPVLEGLVHRTRASKGDVICVLANAAMVFFYLWSTLYRDARTLLAFCAVGMCAAHLVVMVAVRLRCRRDRDLQVVLLALGLVFATVALPLYWKMNALVMAWAIEGVMLTLIGIRYRSVLTRLAGVVATGLACANLLLRLPMHSGEFDFVVNPVFGTWCFVGAAVFAGHLIYRFVADRPEDEYGLTAQMLYALMGGIILAAATMEWYLHCRYNLPGYSFANVIKGQVVIMAGLLALFVLRPVCPPGTFRQALSMVVAGAGSLCALTVLPFLHNRDFTLFANKDFCTVSVFILAMAVSHMIYRFTCERPNDSRGLTGQFLYGVTGGLVMLAAGAEWYFHCKYNFAEVAETVLDTPLFARGTVVILAAMLLFFTVRPICPRGVVVCVFAVIVAVAGSLYTMIAFGLFYDEAFTIFINVGFVTAVSFVAALAIAAWLLKRRQTALLAGCKPAVIFGLGAVFVFWVLMTRQIWLYWQCANEYGDGVANWRFLAYMYISVAWALYGAAMVAAGFALRMRILRYLALGLFALLLGKVFIIDTSRISPVYRMAAFFATGITLVGVSYMYQFLNKKGFFEHMPADRDESDAGTPEEESELPV